MPLEFFEERRAIRDKQELDASWPQRLSTGLIGLLAIGLTGFRTPCAAAVTRGLALCATTLLPALFPFFVLSGLVIETGIAQRAGRLFSPLMHRLFHLPGCGASVFLLGALGGYPTGARAVVQLYQQRMCTKEDAQRLLSLCNNCGPGFFLGMVGGNLLGNTRDGLILWLIHLFSALAVAYLCRKHACSANSALPACSSMSLPQALVKAITGAMQSTLGVCGFVLFFSVLLSLMQETGILSVASRMICLFGFDPSFGNAVASGLLEISCGIEALTKSVSSRCSKGAAAAFLLGFGGCSVLFQTMQQTEMSDLSLSPALMHKLLQATLSAFLSYLYLFFMYSPVQYHLFDAHLSNTQIIGLVTVCFLLFSVAALVKGRKSRYNASRNR